MRILSLSLTLLFLLSGLYTLTQLPKASAVVSHRAEATAALVEAINLLHQQGDSLILQNKKHKATFSPKQLQFSPQNQGPDFQWKLTSEFPMKAPQPISRKEADGTQHIVYEREGITEKYRIGPDFIEQLFVLDEMPNLVNNQFRLQGSIQCDGRFYREAEHWVWENKKGKVRLGDVTVYDADRNILAASMQVTADQSLIIVDGGALASATFPVTIDPVIDASDLTISSAGSGQTADNPEVAYNPDDDEYVAVYSANLNSASSYDIYAQRINAATGALIGSPLRITNRSGGQDALDPDIVYNETENEFFVIWNENSPNVKVGGRRVARDLSGLLGSEATLGSTVNTSLFLQGSRVAWNSTDNEYFAVFNDVVQASVFTCQSIKARRISAAGALLGGLITVEDANCAGSPGRREYFSPDVAYNSDKNEYLLVYRGANTAEFDFEIYCERFSNTGTNLQGKTALTSTTNPNNTTIFPRVAYNRGGITTGQYLVTFQFQPNPSSQTEVYGQMVSATGSSTLNSYFPISDQTDSKVDFYGEVVFNPFNSEFLVTWQTLNFGFPEAVRVQRFNSTGTKIGSAETISTGLLNLVESGLAIRDNTHEGLVVFEKANNFPIENIYARRYATQIALPGPTAVCQNFTVALNAAGAATLNPADLNNGSSGGTAPLGFSASKTSFSCGDLGPNAVTLTVTDATNASSSCSATVTIRDVTPPTAICQNRFILLDASGNKVVGNNYLHNGSFDNCTALTLANFAINPSTVTCNDVGGLTATMTVTDASGNSSTCSSTLTVIDPTSPTVTPMQNVAVSLGPDGTATITASTVSSFSDACGVAFESVTPNTFNCTHVGAGPVALVIRIGDSKGNFTNNTNASVIVSDPLPPDAVCKNVTLSLDANGDASIADSDLDGGSTDNCGIATYGASQTTFTCSDIGNTPVTLTVTDNNGNTASCQATVTVTDISASVALCQDITLDLNSNGQASIAPSDIDAGSSDNCAAITNLSLDLSSFDCTSIGKTASWQQVGTPGLSGINTFQQDIKIGPDGNPIIAFYDDDNFIKVYKWDGSAWQPLAGPGIANAQTPFLSLALAPDGTPYIAFRDNNNSKRASVLQWNGTNDWIAVGSAGFTGFSTSNHSLAIAPDGTPYLAFREDFNGDRLKVYSWNGTTWGILGGFVSAGFASSPSLAVAADGTPYVTCQDGGNGNKTIVRKWDGSNWVAVGAAGGISVGIASDQDLAIAPDGTLYVTYRDLSANQRATVLSWDGSSWQTVGTAGFSAGQSSDNRLAIRNDGTPVLAIQDLSIGGGQATVFQWDGSSWQTVGSPGIFPGTPWSLSLKIALAPDGMPWVILSNSSANFQTEVLKYDGENFTTLTVTDATGASSQCRAWVEVEDQTPPAATCTNITINLDANGNRLISNGDINAFFSATDACGLGTHTGIFFQPFTCANLGNNPGQTFYLNDLNGNTTTCVVDVMVMETFPPHAVCKNITVSLNTNGDASIASSDLDGGSTDNCGIATFSASKTTFDCSNLGSNQVTLDVIDASGNVSSCTASVTVENNHAPTASCQNFTFNLPGTTGSISGSDVDAGSASFCTATGVSLSFAPATFSCNELGPQTVTLTVTDNGNLLTSSCTATVEVADPNSFCCDAPVAACQDITVSLDANGNYDLAVSEVDNGSDADCGQASISLNLQNFNCQTLGAQTVTLTITDIKNASDQCTASVTVVDDTSPTITLTGDATVEVCQFSTYTDAGATYEDNCGGTGNVTHVTSSVNANQDGTYTVKYNYSDPSGNAATEITRTVIVNPTPDAFASQGCGNCGQIRYDICQFDPVQNLNTFVMANANYETGTSLNWYTDAGGSQGSALPGPPAVNSNQQGTDWYWVSQQLGDCPSPAIRVRVRVKKQFAPDFNLPTIGCGGAAQLNLAAWVSDPGNKTNLYTFYSVDPVANPGATPVGTATATNGVVNFGQTVIVNVTNGSQTYWVQNTVPNGCGSTTSATLTAAATTASLNFIPNQIVNCGDAVNIAFSGTNATHIIWFDIAGFNNPNIGIIGTLGLGSLAFTATNTSGTPQTATIRVIPYNGNCAGQFQDFTITVQPGAGCRQGQVNSLQLAASRLNPHDVLLSWDIRFDQELIRFEVEKKRNDGEFESIGFQNWKGNGDYQFTDESGMSNANLYRLKLIYADGRIVWSETVEVNIDFVENHHFNLFPNPTSVQFRVKALFPMEASYTWQLSDVMGKTLMQGKMEEQQTTIQMESLAAGVYHLVMISPEGRRYLMKVIKQ